MFKKPPIAPVSFILGIKISENVLYIVIKVGIRIYSKNLRKARVFQKICEVYLYVWEDQGFIDMLES